MVNDFEAGRNDDAKESVLGTNAKEGNDLELEEMSSAADDEGRTLAIVERLIERGGSSVRFWTWGSKCFSRFGFPPIGWIA